MLLELGAGMAVGALGVGLFTLFGFTRPRRAVLALDPDIEASGAGFVRVDLPADHPWLGEVPALVAALRPGWGFARRAALAAVLRAVRWALPGRMRLVLGPRGDTDVWLSFARSPPGPRPRFSARGPNRGEWLGPNAARLTLPAKEADDPALPPVGREIVDAVGVGVVLSGVFPPRPGIAALDEARKGIRLWGVELEGDAERVIARFVAWPKAGVDPAALRETLGVAWDRLRDEPREDGVEIRFERVTGSAPIRAALTVARPVAGWHVALRPLLAREPATPPERGSAADDAGAARR